MMFDAVVDERNVRRVGQGLPVQLSPRNSAGNTSWILHFNFVARRVIAENDRIIGPISRDARVNAKCRPAHAESQNPLYPCAIEPARRTGVPGPSAAPRVGRLGVNIARGHIRLDFVALHAGSGSRTVDRIEHSEQVARSVAITERSEGQHSPHGSMRVLSAVFANSWNVTFDVAGIKRRMVKWRRKKQNQTLRPAHQLLFDRPHGSHTAAQFCRTADYSPGLCDGINSALR